MFLWWESGGAHNSASMVLRCQRDSDRDCVCVCVRVCVRTHTRVHTPCMYKMLIFMHFLFWEKRKYLLNTKCFTNHSMLMRNLDGTKFCLSNKGVEGRRG